MLQNTPLVVRNLIIINVLFFLGSMVMPAGLTTELFAGT
jgi:hypothetical protein